ncbi:MAG: hypothetical protein OHK0029_11170 [Armatimonadaceae bacterium]
MKTLIRDGAADVFRKLPPFRGKARLGEAIGRLTTNTSNDLECLRTITMWDGTKMTIDLRSRTEVWAYWTGEYDRSILSRLISILNNNSVVLDVGANVGFYSIPFGRALCTLNGRVFAFEPVPSNFDRLKQAVYDNSLVEIVTLEPIALGDKRGVIEMHLETENNASTGNAVILNDSIRKIAGWGETNASAEVYTLDEYAEQMDIPSCKLIKIDIEGAEMNFLTGASGFIRRHRPIVFGEFNPYWLKHFGTSLDEVLSFFSRIDYRFFRQLDSETVVEFMEPVQSYQDIFLVPSEENTETLQKIGVK